MASSIICEQAQPRPSSPTTAAFASLRALSMISKYRVGQTKSSHLLAIQNDSAPLRCFDDKIATVRRVIVCGSLF
jgi:hypothetical protein